MTAEQMREAAAKVVENADDHGYIIFTATMAPTAALRKYLAARIRALPASPGKGGA